MDREGAIGRHRLSLERDAGSDETDDEIRSASEGSHTPVGVEMWVLGEGRQSSWDRAQSSVRDPDARRARTSHVASLHIQVPAL